MNSRCLLLAACLAALIVAEAPGVSFAAEKRPPKPVQVTSTAAPAPESAPKPAVAGVTTERGTGWIRTDITLDGRLRGMTRLAQVGARLALAFLVEPESTPPAASGSSASGAACEPRPSAEAPPGGAGHLLVWDPAAPGKLSPRGEGIPAGARLEAGDLDGDGNADVLVLAEGEILGIAVAGGRPLPLVSDVALGSPDRTSGYRLVDRDDLRLHLALLGSLRSYGLPAGSAGGDAGSRWGLLSETPLPVAAERREESIALSSPVVFRVPGGGRKFVTAPQEVGTERLLVRLLDPDAAEGKRSVECWAKLPAAERLLEWQVLVLDGNPVLLVTTMPADKLSLFGEKLVRVFPLAGDRTRGGAAPLFAAQSGMNLWQPMHPLLRDADADGRADLVIGYWKGMKDSTLVLETYLREPGGGFRTRARSESFDVEGGEHSFLSVDRDVTGDGAPDAVVAAGKKLCVHPGATRPDSPEALVAKRPALCVPLPMGLDDFGEMSASMSSEGFGTNQVGGDSAQVFEDLDGDGRAEILLIGLKGSIAGGAAGRVSVIRFD